MFGTLDFWVWAATAVLVALYGLAGLLKAFRPIDKLAGRLPWVADMPRLARFVGGAEIAGALGLVLPVLTGILAWLTPLAALGLSLIQVLAGAFHLRRGEVESLPLNAVLLALSLFVLWARKGLLGL
ncbi:MAG: DoxX family protein [Bauldia sp.]